MKFSWDLNIVSWQDERRMQKEVKRLGSEEELYRAIITNVVGRIEELKSEGRKFVPNYSLPWPKMCPNTESIERGKMEYDFQWDNCCIGCSLYYAAYIEAYYNQIVLPEHRRMIAQYESFDNFVGKFMELESDILALGGEIQLVRPKIRVALPMPHELKNETFEIVPTPRNLHVMKGKIELLLHEETK